MALVKKSIMETWYQDENNFIFKNFDFIFKNYLWDISDSKPRGFSVCPFLYFKKEE